MTDLTSWQERGSLVLLVKYLADIGESISGVVHAVAEPSRFQPEFEAALRTVHNEQVRAKVVPNPRILRPSPVYAASPAEIAWATGVFEGEGSILMSERRPGSWQAHLSLTMTDEDVVRRVGSILGGNVTGPHIKPRFAYKPFWHWQISRHDDVGALLNLMWPWLGERRRRRATDARNCTHLTFARKGPKKTLWQITGMKPWHYEDEFQAARAALDPDRQETDHG